MTEQPKVWGFLAQVSEQDPKMAKVLFDSVYKEACPGRDHMNGAQIHAYDNGFCLFCKRPKPAGDETPHADADTCNICGESVAPGSGRWVDRVPCGDTPKERAENGRDYPTGDFICPECASPKELGDD